MSTGRRLPRLLRPLLALALVGHLWMLTSTAPAPATSVGDEVLALGGGDAGVAPVDDMDPHGHWMALTCVAVVALGFAVRSPGGWPVRGSAWRLARGRALLRAATPTRPRDLWPTPAPGDRRVCGGTVLLV